MDTSSAPPIRIVYEDDTLLVVDKPSTLPIHPCGGYNLNSLLELLSHWKPDTYGTGKLFTVHRLDRLISGLVLIAKSSAVAREMGKCISDRDGCEKIYLARVAGRFPMGLPSMEKTDSSWGEYQYNIPPDDDKDNEECYPNKRVKISFSPPCQYGEPVESKYGAWKGGLRVPFVNSDGKKRKQDNDDNHKQSYAGLGYWISNMQGTVQLDASLLDIVEQCKDSVSITEAIGSMVTDSADNKNTAANESLLWINFACPCRIASHKNGICEAGSFPGLENDKGIKPAQTSFTLLSYDEESDTSLVLAKPVTGRTHQIRLHLQKMGHPIANDHCYGGELWFGDDEGKEVCRKSREWLDQLDQGTATASQNATNADTPANEAELYHSAANREREDGESILDFIRKTCVWCARCHGVAGLEGTNDRCSGVKQNDAVFRRTLMEYLVRSQGIWLHALQYSMKTDQNKSLSYRTKLPSWATSIGKS